MKKNIVFVLICFFILTSSSFLFFSYEKRYNPEPKEINEGEEMKEKRKEWWEKKHGAAAGVDWKAMDEQTRRERAFARNQNRKELYENGQLKSNEKILETFGNGSLTGEWSERGSDNIAGRIHTCDIDFENNIVYAASAGGVLWKGSLNGEDWQPLNDYMTANINFVRYLPTQTGNRLMMTGDKYFFYSDNDGLSWETSTGLENVVSWGNIVRTIVTNTSPRVLYLLTLEWDDGPNWEAVAGLYRSDDLGETFSAITTFPGWANDVDIWTARYGTSGNTFLVYGSDFYKLDNSGQPDFVSDIGSSGGRAVITGMEDVNGVAHISVYSDDKIYRSDDNGNNWILKGDEPDGLWGRNSFNCSLTNPDRLYFGAVNCHISNNGGASWFARNEWYEYYGQENYQLHADIDGVDIFRDNSGNELIMVSTDGGLYKSYDQLNVVDNIAEHGLRTGQFYSTYTNRNNTNYVYMGSQDQGFQKCRVDSGGVLGFKQSISGDYGSICSGDNGNSIWTVYPNFAMYYPDASDLADFAAFWDFSGYNWQWMAPTMPDPLDYNYAFIGGGDEVLNGQYLWHLYYISGNIEAERLPYDFSINRTNEITAIAYSPIDWNYRYVLTNKGRFFYSDDEGQTWTLSTFNKPDLWGNVIIPSPTQLGKIYIGGSGYSNSGVFVSENHGQNFTALDNNIPETSFNDLKLSSNELLLFAATDAGPYFYNFNTAEWYDMAGVSAPDQTYMSVDFIPSLNTVRFGTYGRGTWDFAIDQEPITSVKENNTVNNVSVYPNPFSESTTIKFNLNKTSAVNIDVYTLSGKKVYSETRSQLAVGEQQIRLNRSQLTRGIYLVSIATGAEKFTRKIVVQ